MKNHLKPFKAMNSVDMAQATQTSTVLDARYFDNVGIQINFSLTAFGTITIASGSGAITATVNSIPISGITWAVSDTATATALAAAINANGQARATVVASSVAGVVTVMSTATGMAGNAYALAATGTGVSVSGATFTAGTAPAGTLQVQTSLDYDENISRVVVNAGNWVQLPLSPSPSIMGSADTIFIDLNQIPGTFLRIVYTKTSGNGLLDAYITAKDV